MVVTIVPYQRLLAPEIFLTDIAWKGNSTQMIRLNVRSYVGVDILLSTKRPRFLIQLPAK